MPISYCISGLHPRVENNWSVGMLAAQWIHHVDVAYDGDLDEQTIGT